ncbi:unspecified product [Leishmania tarentolae]|uniref:Unspecified product n=1 Tax=Leishmania tarentolae TaxID=5689 RepID=A0A640KRY3_LEITA|nr:unspecified product [Leishmania tarentolae]
MILACRCRNFLACPFRDHRCGNVVLLSTSTASRQSLTFLPFPWLFYVHFVFTHTRTHTHRHVDAHSYSFTRAEEGASDIAQTQPCAHRHALQVDRRKTLMSASGSALSGEWLQDTQGLLSTAQDNAFTPSSPPAGVLCFPLAVSSSNPSSTGSPVVDGDPTPYGVTAQQLDALSAMAYLVGSPLQQQQPVGGDMTHPGLLVAAKLLQHGVDPERIIEVIECRCRDAF